MMWCWFRNHVSENQFLILITLNLPLMQSLYSPGHDCESRVNSPSDHNHITTDKLHHIMYWNGKVQHLQTRYARLQIVTTLVPGWLTVLKSGYAWLALPQIFTRFPWRFGHILPPFLPNSPLFGNPWTMDHYLSPWINGQSCIPILILSEPPRHP